MLGAASAAVILVVSLLAGQAAGGANAATATGFDYAEALGDSMFFYAAQDSGQLAPDNPVDWRGDSDLSDGADNGVNLTGGMHDAGDLVKFGLPQAYTTAMLAWGLADFQQGYQSAGQYQAALANLRWNDDYIIAAHTAPDVYYAQVADPTTDHQFWGPAETNPTTRPSFAVTATCPGSDIVGEASAAMAASSIVFRTQDPKYSAQLLAQAQSLFSFANTDRGKYSDCVTKAQGFYTSFSGYWDELTEAAIWLYQATGDTTWLTTAETDYTNLAFASQQTVHEYNWTLNWDDVTFADYLLLAQATGGAQYVGDAERWLDWWTVGANGTKVAYSPGGEAVLDQWGSLRYAANTAFGALEMSDYLTANGLDPSRASTYHDFAVSQIDYALGDNPNHMSYEIGFTNGGTNSKWPTQPHNSTAHDPWSDNLATPPRTRHLDYGLLVGGPPAANDAFSDDRTNFQQTEGALDYNALFSGALARLVQSDTALPVAGFPAPESPDGPEMYVQAAVNSVGSNFIEIKALVNNQSAWPARHLTNSSIRYYFTLDPGESPSQITLSSPFNQCQAPAGPTQYAGAVYYVTVSCANMDIAPDGEDDYPGINFQAQMQFRITFPAAHDYQSDWSFQGVPTTVNGTPVTAGAITLYSGNTLVWGAPPSTGTGPAAPGPLTATAVTGTGATLTWGAATPGSDPVSGYVIRTSAGTPVATVPATTTSFALTGLNASRTTPYGYFVQAVDTHGLASPGSNIATFITSPNTSRSGGAAVTPPSVPGTVTATSVTGTSATLAWGASTPGSSVITGYRVYELTPNPGLVATTTTPTLHLTGLTAGTVGEYEVVATASSGPLSLASAPAVFVTPTGTATTPPPTTTTPAPPPTTTAPPTTAPPTTTTSAAPPPASGGCQATYSVTTSWAGGFQAAVTVTAGTAPINGWTVTWTFGGDQQVTSLWNASFTQTGKQVTADNLSYDGTLPVGGSTGLGFTGSYGTSNAAPTGVTCVAH